MHHNPRILFWQTDIIKENISVVIFWRSFTLIKTSIKQASIVQPVKITKYSLALISWTTFISRQLPKSTLPTFLHLIVIQITQMHTHIFIFIRNVCMGICSCMGWCTGLLPVFFRWWGLKSVVSKNLYTKINSHHFQWSRNYFSWVRVRHPLVIGMGVHMKCTVLLLVNSLKYSMHQENTRLIWLEVLLS